MSVAREPFTHDVIDPERGGVRVVLDDEAVEGPQQQLAALVGAPQSPLERQEAIELRREEADEPPLHRGTGRATARNRKMAPRTYTDVELGR